MITPQSHAYNKNKCNLISRSDGGARPIDLVFEILIIPLQFDISFAEILVFEILIIPLQFDISFAACSVHLEKTTDKNLAEMGTKLYKKTH